MGCAEIGERRLRTESGKHTAAAERRSIPSRRRRCKPPQTRNRQADTVNQPAETFHSRLSALLRLASRCSAFCSEPTVHPLHHHQSVRHVVARCAVRRAPVRFPVRLPSSGTCTTPVVGSSSLLAAPAGVDESQNSSFPKRNASEPRRAHLCTRGRFI